VEKIALSINDNYRQTEKYIDVVQTLQQYQETKVFTDNFLINHQHIFEKRVITQKIRECHGDLHLKNICIFNDKIQLFDRIEFNEEFRFVDVMYDVAFTVMDLHSKGEEKLANIFLNTYLEYTGDWEGVMVLPLYLSRQAYVRAKVTSFLLDDLSVDKEEKEKAKQTAKDYYNLAWKYTKKNRAKLILMSGLSGSGKSTVACKMAQELNAIHIRSDAVRKHLAQIALQEKGTNDIYSPEMNDKTYGRLLELAQLLIDAGFTVILDAKYDRISARKPVVEWTKNQQIPLEIVYCHAPFSVMCDRISQRQGDISDATPEILKKQQEQLELFTEEEKPLVTKINTYD
jgi:predicted kinase